MALSAKTCEMHAPALGSGACVPHLLNDTVKRSLERTSQLQLSSPNVDHFARSGLRCVVCTVLTHHKIRGPPESHCTSQKESFRVAKNDVFLLSPLGTSYVARIHFWRNLRKPDLRKHLNITNPEGKHIWATEFWEILWQNLLVFLTLIVTKMMFILVLQHVQDGIRYRNMCSIFNRDVKLQHISSYVSKFHPEWIPNNWERLFWMVLKISYKNTFWMLCLGLLFRGQQSCWKNVKSHLSTRIPTLFDL